MEIRRVLEEEMNNALDLVWRVFLKYEAPDYTEEGIEEFHKSIRNKEWVNEREFFGAFENNELLGVIATKDITHIALFFVDGKYHHQGIGKKLFQYVDKRNVSHIFTVNSSPYAHEIYKHLGFVDLDKEQVFHGLRFYPMKKDI